MFFIFFEDSEKEEKFFTEVLCLYINKDKNCIKTFDKYFGQKINEKKKNDEKLYSGIQITGPLSCVYLFVDTLSKFENEKVLYGYSFVVLFLPFIFYLFYLVNQQKLNRQEMIKNLLNASFKRIE